MPPAQSVGKRKKTTPDRLSNLPPNVTQKILECLPLQDAARTSILSSHWKHEWASISHLVLDKKFFTSILKRKLKTADISLAYIKAVNDILLSHTGPICKFDLYLPSWFPKETDVSRWIQYARGRGLKELALVDDRGREKNFPTCLFSYVGLTNLTLISCKLVSIPPTFKGFPCLVSLKVDCPIVQMNLLELLISKCPLLETLYLCVFLYDANLTIRAPNLKYLFVEGFLKNLCLEGNTGISTLALDISCYQLQNSRYMSEFFSRVVNVKKLTIKNFWEDVEQFQIPGKFPRQLERLQTLRLVDIPLHCRSSIHLALCIISSSPLLEQL